MNTYQKRTTENGTEQNASHSSKNSSLQLKDNRPQSSIQFKLNKAETVQNKLVNGHSQQSTKIVQLMRNVTTQPGRGNIHPNSLRDRRVIDRGRTRIRNVVGRHDQLHEHDNEDGTVYAHQIERLPGGKTTRRSLSPATHRALGTVGR